jgi:hypothetical protein
VTEQVKNASEQKRQAERERMEKSSKIIGEKVMTCLYKNGKISWKEDNT